MPPINFNRRTALYRLFNAEGELLYVGVAFDPEARWEQHRKSQPWWPQVARKATEWHDERGSAERAEQAAIRAENPRYNKMHMPLPPEFVPLGVARRRLKEIVDSARDHGIATALTEYGRPRAFVVSVPFVERAERDAALLARLRELHAELVDQIAASVEPVTVPTKLSKAA